MTARFVGDCPRCAGTGYADVFLGDRDRDDAGRWSVAWFCPVCQGVRRVEVTDRHIPGAWSLSAFFGPPARDAFRPEDV